MPSNVARGRNGAFYPKHPILLAVAALPFYVVAGDAGLLAFNLAQLGALVLVMSIGARRYAPGWVAFALIVWFAFGTLLRSAAYNFAPDVLSTLLVAGGVVALAPRPEPHGRRAPSGCRCGRSGRTLVFFPVALVALAARRDWRALLRFAAAAAVPLMGLLGLNWRMFGSPLVTPSGRVLVVSNARWVLEPSHRTFFTVPFWRGLWTQLTDARMGLVRAAPPVTSRAAGVRRAVSARPAGHVARRRGMRRPARRSSRSPIEWNVSSYGPRFLLSVVALSALPAAAALAAVVKRVHTYLRPTDAVA